MLQGKKILLAISGSIAAYKAAMLTRLLIKEGAEVQIIMTAAAKEFVSPLTLSTLSKNKVLSNLVVSDSWTNHVALGRWADIMVIAPLSCNTLAKMAAGLCDNLLMAVYLSATCKVVGAPAMDEDMWLHPSTKNNLKQVIAFGNEVIPVESGELASGLTAEGRMAEPESIVQWLNNFFTPHQPLRGKRAMVTAGPTYEQIDPVRFIGNYSSGKMGIAIAKELTQQGAEVTLVLGPTSLAIPENLHSVIRIKTAAEMYTACNAAFGTMDITVMSAAVADYTPLEKQPEKIKKGSDTFSLDLTKTKDILKYLGQIKRSDQLTIGFALETHNEETFAKDKLADKNADMIVLNSLNDKGAGFGDDTNKITIFERSGNTQYFDIKSKDEVARDIVVTIIKLQNALPKN